jgi:hypothetical protein
VEAGQAPRIGTRWRLWDQFALRGAGFPADGVLRLAPHGLATAADRLAHSSTPDGPEWTAYESEFAAAAVKVALDLQDAAAAPTFRTAVGWQNRSVLEKGIRPFLRWRPTEARSSQPRQREELVAHYVQRFCAKNDTIGFFGPVGWGRIDPTTPGLAVDPGSGLVARTTVYFSSWAIDGLARILDADPACHAYVAPRRMPFVRLDDLSVTVPGRRPQTLPPGLARVLERCDGVTPAAELGDDVDGALAELVRRRLVVWRLEVPADAHPERHLRSWLEGVGDPAARDRGLARLDRLQRGRDRVAAAAGPDALAVALGELEADYAEITDEAGARTKGGGTPPGRGLVYADSRRSASVRLGSDVLAAMAPLEPLLAGAAWLCSSLAERVAVRVREVFDRLGPTDLATFWFACMPVLHSDAVADAAELRAEMRARWSALLSLPAGASRVRLSLRDVAGPAATAFAAPGGGWPAARYLSPDLLVAARGPDAVRRGEYELVLGELHVAMNTLAASLFVHQHPEPAQLLALTDRDFPGPRLLPLLPKEHRSRLSTRIRHVLVRPEDYYVALVDFTADPHRPRTVASADVRVDLRDGRLVAILPDGATFGVLDVFAHVLTTLVVDGFSILPEERHTPRVTVDSVVVARETWRLRPDELDFADERDEARRFVRARRWVASYELPRFVFVTLPTEPRPMLVDLEAPVYVNILAKAVRRMTRTGTDADITITEMLPAPDQTWLTDDRGDRYTAELRFVAVDTTA